MSGHQQKVDEECEEMKKDIMRLGTKGSDGKYVVKFGPLFDDEKGQQYYEAIVGTLKAAKKKGILTFEGQMLLKVRKKKTKKKHSIGEIRVPATTIFTKNHKKSQQITTNHTKSHKINTKNHKKKILFTTNHKKSQKSQKITSNHKKKILFTNNHKKSQTKNPIHKKSQTITKNHKKWM